MCKQLGKIISVCASKTGVRTLNHGRRSAARYGWFEGGMFPSTHTPGQRPRKKGGEKQRLTKHRILLRDVHRVRLLLRPRRPGGAGAVCARRGGTSTESRSPQGRCRRHHRGCPPCATGSRRRCRSWHCVCSPEQGRRSDRASGVACSTAMTSLMATWPPVSVAGTTLTACSSE